MNFTVKQDWKHSEGATYLVLPTNSLTLMNISNLNYLR